MAIRLLSEDVASQIAAGEVVERPASVVKELIENSLDAGATQIDIRCLGAGKKLIEVEDNGNGIPADELPLSVQRHATSKIETAEDLYHIRTMGFRGEALAAISSISRFSITSRTRDMEAGARIEVVGGILNAKNFIGVPFGTSVRVEDLFFNVPARLKFLKHDQTERQHIDNVVAHYALANPHVQFRFSQEGKTALITSGNGDQLEILISMQGLEIAKQMIDVNYVDRQIRVRGFISPPSVTRSSRKDFHFYVNRRPVQDNSLAASVIQAYQNYLMVGRFPRVWLFIEIDPEIVDVNVHPTKAEVRFSNPAWLFGQIQHAVRRALMAKAPIPELYPQPIWGHDFNKDQNQLSTPQRTQSEEIQHVTWQIQPSMETFQRREHIPLLRLIGQVAATYLVAEGSDGLYLIDQHAAHERILFEKYLKEANGQVGTQRLLQPVVVEVPPAQSRLLEGELPTLNALGFEVEEFGSGAFQMRAIPSLLMGMHPAEALKAVIDNFEEDEQLLQNETTKRIIARICKRAAVKGGQILSLEEQRVLIADLEACESPRTCPHGRPTMIHLSVELLERQFGRRGV